MIIVVRVITLLVIKIIMVIVLKGKELYTLKVDMLKG